MKRRTSLLLAAFALALTACGGATSTDTSAEPRDASLAADGEDLYKRTVLANNGGCVTCHSLTAGKVLVGPSLADIGSTAADRTPGMSGRDYLLASILSPDAFVVAGFEAGRMPSNWAESLSAEQIEAIVDYMLTLGAG